MYLQSYNDVCEFSKFHYTFSHKTMNAWKCLVYIIIKVTQLQET
jgi:hypothetical protein